MRTEFTAREIELMLLLLHEEITDRLELNKSDVLAMEECQLMEKLENVLRSLESDELDTFNLKSNSQFH